MSVELSAEQFAEQIERNSGQLEPVENPHRYWGEPSEKSVWPGWGRAVAVVQILSP